MVLLSAQSIELAPSRAGAARVSGGRTEVGRGMGVAAREGPPLSGWPSGRVAFWPRAERQGEGRGRLGGRTITLVETR